MVARKRGQHPLAGLGGELLGEGAEGGEEDDTQVIHFQVDSWFAHSSLPILRSAAEHLLDRRRNVRLAAAGDVAFMQAAAMARPSGKPNE